MKTDIVVERTLYYERFRCIMDSLKEEFTTEIMQNDEKRRAYAKKLIENGEVWIASLNKKDVGYAAYYYNEKERMGYFSILAVDQSLGLLGSRVMYELIRVIFKNNEDKDYTFVRFEGRKNNKRVRHIHENFGCHCVGETEEKYVMEISYNDLKSKLEKIENR